MPSPPSSLTNDTRIPPQAKVLSRSLLGIGVVILVLIVRPWSNPSFAQSYTFWILLAVIAVVSWTARHTIKVAEQWERAVVLRFGEYRGLRGPGYFFVIPIIEYVSHHVDQRVYARLFRA